MKDHDNAKQEVKRHKEYSQGIGLQSLMSLPIFTQPKTSLHSANLTTNENPTTIASATSKGSGSLKVGDNDSPLFPAQDYMLDIQNLAKNANASLLVDLNQEYDSSLDKKLNLSIIN